MTKLQKTLKYLAALTFAASLAGCGGTSSTATNIAGLSTASTNGVIGGTTGNSANGVRGTYNGTALQGELLLVTLDTDALTFTYQVEKSAYILGWGVTKLRPGVLVPAGLGCWDLHIRGWNDLTGDFTGTIASGKTGNVCARADGMLVLNYVEPVGGVNQTFNALLTPAAINAATPPTAADLVGSYNILIYSHPAGGGKVSLWMQAQINYANGVLTVLSCTEADIASPCFGTLGSRSYRLDSIAGQSDRYTMVNTTNGGSTTIGTLSVSKIDGQVVLNGDINNATGRGLWMGVPTTVKYLKNAIDGNDGSFFTGNWTSKGAIDNVFAIDFHTMVNGNEVNDTNGAGYDLDQAYSYTISNTAAIDGPMSSEISTTTYNCAFGSCSTRNGLIDFRLDGPINAYAWKGIVVGKNIMVFIPQTTSNAVTTPMILYRQ